MIFPPYDRPDLTIVDMIADLVLLGAWLGIIIFVLAYATLFSWRKTAAGKAIMYFTCSLLAVLAVVLAARISGGDYFGRDWIRLGAYSLTCASAWGLVITLARAWRRGEKPLELRERERMRRGGTGPQRIDDTSLNLRKEQP